MSRRSTLLRTVGDIWFIGLPVMLWTGIFTLTLLQAWSGRAAFSLLEEHPPTFQFFFGTLLVHNLSLIYVVVRQWWLPLPWQTRLELCGWTCFCSPFALPAWRLLIVRAGQDEVALRTAAERFHRLCIRGLIIWVLFLTPLAIACSMVR